MPTIKNHLLIDENQIPEKLFICLNCKKYDFSNLRSEELWRMSKLVAFSQTYMYMYMQVKEPKSSCDTVPLNDNLWFDKNNPDLCCSETVSQ